MEIHQTPICFKSNQMESYANKEQKNLLRTPNKINTL